MIYTASFAGVTVSAVQDLFEILMPADACGRFLQLLITQSSEAGDTESEGLNVSVSRVTGSPTSGSAGSTATPTAREGGQPASGATVEINNTTQLSGGTSTLLHRESFNVMAGLSVIWTPELAPIISPSTRLVVALNTAPADSITMDGSISWDEIGG